MGADEKKIDDIVSAALYEERAKRIKKLVRKKFSEEFIMELFEMDAETYEAVYNRLYPFGNYVGVFAEHMENEIKTRFLRKAGYTEKEIQVILQEQPLFFSEEVERKLDLMFKEEIEKRINQDLD